MYFSKPLQDKEYIVPAND